MLPLLALLSLASDSSVFIRVNQVGYLPDAPKVAVACALDSSVVSRFSVIDARGVIAFKPHETKSAGVFGPCLSTFRLDFSTLRTSGKYRVVAGKDTSPVFRIGAH